MTEGRVVVAKEVEQPEKNIFSRKYIETLFAVKKPCKDCPFQKKNDYLAPGRLEEIITDLHQNVPFFCHKTINYSEEDKEAQIQNAKYCAGSMLYLRKCRNTNVPMRLAQHMGLFKPDELKGEDLIIDPMGLDLR